jgi:serine/threonine protein kinase
VRMGSGGGGGGGYGVLEAASDTVSSLYSWLLSLCCSTSCSTSSVTVNGRSLRVVRQLAEGGFSFVFLVDAGGGEKFALKKVLTQLPEQAEAARWEIKVHSSIQHPNVMPLIDHCVVPAANGAEEFRLLSARSAALPNPLVCLSPAAELLLLLLLPSPFALTAASPPRPPLDKPHARARILMWSACSVSSSVVRLLAVPLFPHGTLLDRCLKLMAQGERMPERECLQIFSSLLKAVAAFHEHDPPWSRAYTRAAHRTRLGARPPALASQPRQPRQPRPPRPPRPPRQPRSLS